MKFRMRSSRVLKKLRAGEVAYCFKINLSDAKSCEIAARYGFDCLWVDMEHVPNDWSTIEKAVFASKAYGVDLMCRVARGAYSNQIRALEADATGIMVPHVLSVEEAIGMVRATRFHPVGRRPIDGGNSDGFYCAIPREEYTEQANRERFVVLQIEDPEALEEVDAIAAIDGVDMLFFGAADYSHALGIENRFEDPRMMDARRKVAAAAKKHHKFAGAGAGPALHQEMIGMGYSFLSVGADVVGLSQYCARLAEACGITCGNPPS